MVVKLAIVGSRTFNNYSLLCEKVKEHFPIIDTIVSGGAKGADSLAERYAKENKIPIKVYRAQWELYGKRAGPKRNLQIVAEATHVIAFHDGFSSGTLHTIRTTEAANKPLTIIKYSQQED